MELPARTREQDDDMLHGAHASRYHWGIAGGPTERGRGEWQISRVHSLLGNHEAALRHARRYMELVDEHGLEEFDRAYAHEALARAFAGLGEHAQALEHRAAASALIPCFDEDEERDFLTQDLATIAAH